MLGSALSQSVGDREWAMLLLVVDGLDELSSLPY